MRKLGGQTLKSRILRSDRLFTVALLLLSDPYQILGPTSSRLASAGKSFLPR